MYPITSYETEIRTLALDEYQRLPRYGLPGDKPLTGPSLVAQQTARGRLCVQARLKVLQHLKLKHLANPVCHVPSGEPGSGDSDSHPKTLRELGVTADAIVHLFFPPDYPHNDSMLGLEKGIADLLLSCDGDDKADIPAPGVLQRIEKTCTTGCATSSYCTITAEIVILSGIAHRTCLDPEMMALETAKLLVTNDSGDYDTLDESMRPFSVVDVRKILREVSLDVLECWAHLIRYVHGDEFSKYT